MKALVALFIIIATAGLVLSLVVHLSALLGLPNPLGKAAWALHDGIFVVWLPAIIAAGRLTRGARRKDYWRAALRGCPRWMRHLTYVFFGYAIVNFALFLFGTRGGGKTESEVLRGFSGHWMAFYSAAAALLYSFVRADTTIPRCVNGHGMSALTNYCKVCGQPALRNGHAG